MQFYMAGYIISVADRWLLDEVFDITHLAIVVYAAVMYC